MLLIGPLGTNFSEIFTQENAFEYAMWEMAAILSWPHCVKCHQEAATTRDHQWTFFTWPGCMFTMTKSSYIRMWWPLNLKDWYNYTCRSHNIGCYHSYSYSEKKTSDSFIEENLQQMHGGYSGRRTLKNSFVSVKVFAFAFEFQLSVFLDIKLMISQHWFCQWLVTQ